jgi:tRNA(Ile2) C34 agmatinyltransferase TiaS
MKNKHNKICPSCGSKMKYKGSRCFVCKKCGKSLIVERKCEYRNTGMFGSGGLYEGNKR